MGETSHPDFTETDIDVIIGVESEHEWSSLQKRITRSLENYSKDMRCFVKTTVQAHETEVASRQLFDYYKGFGNFSNLRNELRSNEDMQTLQKTFPFLHVADKRFPVAVSLPLEYFRKDLIYCVLQKPATLLFD